MSDIPGIQEEGQCLGGKERSRAPEQHHYFPMQSRVDAPSVPFSVKVVVHVSTHLQISLLNSLCVCESSCASVCVSAGAGEVWKHRAMELG